MRTQRIAHLYDDPGPFATVQLDVSRDSEDAAHQVELQVRAARERLEEQGAPEHVLDQLEPRLLEPVHQPAPVSRTLVATERDVLLDETVHARTDQPVAEWAALPALTSWIAIEDGSMPFVLALVDHTGGDVATYRSDITGALQEASVGEDSEHVHKVRGGGWSHLRYQNVAENVWRDNAEAVAEQVGSYVSQGYRLVLLAGDPKSCSQVRQLLGSGPAEVVDLDTGGRGSDGSDEALQGAVQSALHQAVVARRLDVAHTLQDRKGRGEAVAFGLDDVLDAFVRGQVDTVVLDPQRSAELTVDLRDHRGLALGAVTQPSQPLLADRVLVAAAALTGADVAVAGSGVLSGEPVAALLRWDQRAEGTA